MNILLDTMSILCGLTVVVCASMHELAVVDHIRLS